MQKHRVLLGFLDNFGFEAQDFETGPSVVLFFVRRNIFGWIGRNVSSIHQMLIGILEFTKINAVVVILDVGMTFFGKLKVGVPQFDDSRGAIEGKSEHLFGLAGSHFEPTWLSVQWWSE